MNTKRNNGRLRSRDAFSLLEVVAGMVVIGLILVPTTVMMRDALRGDATQRNRGELLQLARGKQTEYAHAARINFRNRTVSGNFNAEGFPAMRFSVEASQDPALNGVAGRLLAIRTFAWHDANGNRTFDTDEPSVELWTAVARATP